MRRLSRYALIAGLVAMTPLSAAGQTVPPGEEGKLAALLPPREDAHICYTRFYSPDHLARHPAQTVTEVAFRLAYYRHDPDEYFPKGQRNYYFAMLARLRGSDTMLAAYGECAPVGDGISCGIDDDGGGVLITRRGPRELLVSLVEFGRLRMDGYGEGGGVVLEPGEDDQQFLLAKIDDTACPAYDAW